MQRGYINQIYIDKENGDFYHTLFSATDLSTEKNRKLRNEDMVVFYELNDKSKVYVMRRFEFIQKYKSFDPYPDLELEKEYFGERKGE